MSNKIRISIILLIFFITPFLGFLAGWLASLNEDQFSDNRAFAVAGGVVLGIFAAIASLILGVIVSYLARNKNPYLSLAGYIIPPCFIILYIIYVQIFI